LLNNQLSSCNAVVPICIFGSEGGSCCLHHQQEPWM
jgi:hypothetical protein